MKNPLPMAALLSLSLCAAAVQAAPPPVDAKRTVGVYECLDNPPISGTLRIASLGSAGVAVSLNTMDTSVNRPCAFVARNCRTEGPKLICAAQDEPDAEIQFIFSSDYRRINIQAGDDARRAFCGKTGVLGNLGARYAKQRRR